MPLDIDIDIDDASFWLHFTPEQVREIEQRLEHDEPLAYRRVDELQPGSLRQRPAPPPPGRMCGAERGRRVV